MTVAAAAIPRPVTLWPASPATYHRGRLVGSAAVFAANLPVLALPTKP